MKTGRVFCSECGDFILDAVTETAFSSAVLTAEEKESRFLGLKYLFLRKGALLILLQLLRKRERPIAPGRRPSESFPPWKLQFRYLAKVCVRSRFLFSTYQNTRSSWASQPRPNLLHERDPPKLRPQPSPPELLFKRQAQPPIVQGYRLHLLRNGQPVLRNLLGRNNAVRAGFFFGDHLESLPRASRIPSARRSRVLHHCIGSDPQHMSGFDERVVRLYHP